MCNSLFGNIRSRFTAMHDEVKVSVFKVNAENGVSTRLLIDVCSPKTLYSHIDVCHCELCTDRCPETSQQQ